MSQIQGTKISLIIPVYNEAKIIESTIMQSVSAVQKLRVPFEIIVVEDGSTDGTDEIVNELANEYPFLFFFHNRKRQGRGTALKKAFKASTGNILVYYDADLSTDLIHIRDGVNAILEGADIAGGSRLIVGSRAERKMLRNVLSKIYNCLVRFFFNSPLHDHQCGFKAFNKFNIIKLLDNVEDTHWFWDTEIIIRAIEHRLNVVEFPITWKHRKTSKVHLLKDTIYMGFKLLRFRLYHLQS